MSLNLVAFSKHNKIPHSLLLANSFTKPETGIALLRRDKDDGTLSVEKALALFPIAIAQHVILRSFKALKLLEPLYLVEFR